MSSITVDFDDLDNVTADVILDGSSLEITPDGLKVSDALIDVIEETGVPVGGTTGQVLAKNSNTNNDVGWVDQTGGGGGGASLDYVLAKDVKSAGTNGGSSTSAVGAFVTRDLNVLAVNIGGHASLASNQLTLAAGTWRCKISVPGFSILRHQALLYDVTNSAILIVGSSEYSNGNATQANSIIVGRFVLAGSTVLEVRHRVEIGEIAPNLGFGNACNFGTSEIYTIGEFWKE